MDWSEMHIYENQTLFLDFTLTSFTIWKFITLSKQ